MKAIFEIVHLLMIIFLGVAKVVDPESMKNVEFGPKTDFDAEVNLRTGEIDFLPTFDCGPRIDLDGK